MPELKEINELRIEHITKRFPGVLACDDISLTIGKHEVLALVGENGAGKTTLMNIVMGLYQSDEGAIYISGEKVSFKAPMTPSPVESEWSISNICWYQT